MRYSRFLHGKFLDETRDLDIRLPLLLTRYEHLVKVRRDEGQDFGVLLKDVYDVAIGKTEDGRKPQ